MTRKMRLHKLILSFALVIGMVLPGPVSHAAETTAGSAVWSADIPALLQAGDYVEGQVVVGIDCSISETAGSALAAVEDDAGTAEELTAASGISIEIIEDPTKTTEELLYLLAEDPRVVFAEPNYTVNRAGEEGQPVEDPEADESAGDPIQFVPGDEQDPQVYERIADLTDLQWSSASSDQLGDDRPDASAHVPDFGGTGSNMEGEPVIVAVIDQPVDYTNPDLAPVMYRFSEAQQQTLGCGEYGYNATWQSKGDELVFFPGGDHGTHCAGIIGAAWDGHGISGAASNVRIISIQNCIADGNTSLINNLRAFAFVKKTIEAGIDIRITSNSYGLLQYSRALDVVVRDLGERYGVVSCFAAGNDTMDIGVLMNMCVGFQDDPYVVIVGATKKGDAIADYSNFSKEFVDIAAPGTNILSTVLSDHGTYIPGAVPEDDLAYYGFEDGDPLEMQIAAADGPEGEEVTFKDEMIEKTAEGSPHFTGQYAGIVPGKPEDPAIRTLEVSLGDQREAADGPLYFGASVYTPGVDSTVRFWVKNKDTGDFETVNGSYAGYGDGYDWFTCSGKLDSNVVDLSDLKIYVEVYAFGDPAEVYIDSVGLGRSTVPYGYMSGTSMATPLVSGIAAVLSAGHGGIRGEELASLVKASVRIAPALSTLTRSSGVIDLAPDVELAPVVTSAVYQEGTLTLKGRYFGDSIGNLKLCQQTAGAEDQLLYDSAGDSGLTPDWSDREITLRIPELSGTLLATVTNSTGKSWRKPFYADQARSLYETELELDRSLKYPETLETLGDHDSSGVLTGLDGKLYHIPYSTPVERQPAAKKMWAYDTENGSWEERAALPEPLYDLSAALYRGQLVVMGMAAKESLDGVFEHPENAEPRVYRYDPSRDEWSSCSSTNVSKGQYLVNPDGKLYLVNTEGCVEYTPEGGAKAALPESNAHLSIAAGRSGEIYIYNYAEMTFGVMKKEGYTDLSDALPRFMVYEGDRLEDEYTRRGIIVPVSEGILLIGPPNDTEVNGTGSDTFLLKWGSKEFIPYEKRVSVNRLFNVSAASYRGAVYVIASSHMEPVDPFFRATAMAVNEYPGDVTQYQWMHNKKGWWIQDGSGWYPKNQWLLVNGYWYYFDEQGYMAHEEWRKGWWLGRNGAWTYEAKGSWHRNSRGWWYQDTAGWYAKNQWQKIDGKWYHFDEKGYMQTGRQWIGGRWYIFSESGALK